MPKSVFTKTYGAKSKQQAAAAAVARARATLVAARRAPLAPPRTGGFFGTRRSMNELKTIDVDPTSITISTTATATLLNGIATGTDFTDRIGRKIIMKSLYFRYTLFPEDETVISNACRFLIVYDSQANGTACSITDVLKSSNPNAQLNLNNRDRFKVIWDSTKAMPYVNNTATQAMCTGQAVFMGKKFKRLGNLEMVFGGTTAAIGSIQTGSIYLLSIGSQASPAASALAFTSRIRFMDA